MGRFNKGLGSLTVPVFLLLAIAVGVVGGRILERRSYYEQLGELSLLLKNPTPGRDKLSATLSLIESEYVDEVSLDSIREKLMPHIFESLDPHSIYIPAQEMPEMNEALEGEFDGIGVVFNMATDTVLVINTVPSGPSADVGIVGGDRIIQVNDTLVAGVKMPQTDVMKRLRGKRGTTVKLSVERGGVDELIDFVVTRDAIPINSINTAMILDDSVGYIKMLQFSRTTHSELITAVAKLKNQGIKSLILDLRGNTGGYLDQAILIANEFLPKEKLIVYTEDRAGEQVRQYSDGTGRLKDIDVALLIDEGSASSSEILAGALQDNDMGTIIGRRSFGKGLVQQQIPFRDGSAVRLTIARYYTPTGRSIQKEYGDSISYDDDILHRIQHNEFFVADSIHFADSLKRITPKGKVVYGGGGIMPDIFVPADTTGMSPYFMEVSARNIIYTYTTHYADTHRKAINSVTTREELATLYPSDKALLSDFVAYASKRGVKANWRDINYSRDIILAQLKAYIGRNTPLDDDAFYINIYPLDKTITKAMEVLTSPKPTPEPTPTPEQ